MADQANALSESSGKFKVVEWDASRGTFPSGKVYALVHWAKDAAEHNAIVLDLLQRRGASLPNLSDDRQYVGCEAISLGLASLTTAVANGIEVRVAQLHTACLGSCQRRLGTLRDQRALLFSQGRVDVEHKRICVATQRRDDERDLVGHQACDETDVASQPIQLGNDDRALQFLRYRKSLAKLWARVIRSPRRRGRAASAAR